MGEYDPAFNSMNDTNVELSRNGGRVYYDTGKRPWPIAPGIVAIQSLLDAGYTRILGMPATWALELASRLREQEVALRTGAKVSFGTDSWRAIENLAIAQLLMSKPGAVPPPIAGPKTVATWPATPVASVPPSGSTKAIDFSVIDAAVARAIVALQDVAAAIAAAKRG